MFDSHHGYYIENGEDRDPPLGESLWISAFTLLQRFCKNSHRTVQSFLDCKNILWYLSCLEKTKVNSLVANINILIKVLVI